jgi:hypothetical protein
MVRLKELLIVGLVLVSLVASLVVLLGPGAESQAAAEPEPQDIPRTLTVIGEGKVSLVPDVAQLNVGAEASAETVAEAKAEVDRLRAAILAALERAGIDQQDIQTSHYSIYYEHQPAVPVARDGSAESGKAASVPGQGRYWVRNMLRVTVRDTDKAGSVLDAVVEAGANQVYGVTFTVSDESRWQGQARGAAMDDARARAGELARLAGVELGQVLSVSEVIGGWPGAYAPVPERSMGGSGIAPGQLEMGTQVQVTFAIQ